MISHQEQAGLRWRRYKPKRRVFYGPINLIALINVVVLMAFFMLLHSDLVLRPGVTVQLPVVEFVSGSAYGSLVVTVTQEGLVFFNDEKIPVEKLSSALSQSLRSTGDYTLTIEADGQVPYNMVMRIINLALSVGVREINLAGRPAFGESCMP